MAHNGRSVISHIVAALAILFSVTDAKPRRLASVGMQEALLRDEKTTHATSSAGFDGEASHAPPSSHPLKALPPLSGWHLEDDTSAESGLEFFAVLGRFWRPKMTLSSLFLHSP